MKKFWWEDKDPRVINERFKELKDVTLGKYQEQFDIYEHYYENKRYSELFGYFENQNYNLYTSYNLIRSIVNALKSRIGTKVPKPMFLTDNGDYLTQKKTKANDTIVNHHFKKGMIYRAGVQAFKTACVKNLGVIKVVTDMKNRCFKYESCDPIKIHVPSPDMGGFERDEIFQEYIIPRSVVIKMWPEAKKKLQERRIMEYQGDDYTEEKGITIVEAWKSSRKHKIFIPDSAKHGAVGDETIILFEEDWKFDFIPFGFYRWESKMEGFYGQGLAEELTPIQRRVNHITRKIAESVDLVAGSRIFVNGQMDYKRKLTNEVGTIYPYTGQNAPMESLWSGVPETYFKHLQDYIEYAFRQSGISEMTAASQKPPGLTSGKALITYNDLETQRFRAAAQEYNDMFIELAQKTYAMGVKYKFSMFEKITDREMPYVDIYPTNLLSDHPSGRYEDLQRLIEMGVVPQGQAGSLLNFPDLKAFESLESATIKATKEIIHKAIWEDQEMENPVMELDLNVQLDCAKKILANSFRKGMEEEKQDKIRDFITKVEEAIQAQQMFQLQQMQMGPGGGAGADVQAPVQGADAGAAGTGGLGGGY